MRFIDLHVFRSHMATGANAKSIHHTHHLKCHNDVVVSTKNKHTITSEYPNTSSSELPSVRNCDSKNINSDEEKSQVLQDCSKHQIPNNDSSYFANYSSLEQQLKEYRQTSKTDYSNNYQVQCFSFNQAYTWYTVYDYGKSTQYHQRVIPANYVVILRYWIHWKVLASHWRVLYVNCFYWLSFITISLWIWII